MPARIQIRPAVAGDAGGIARVHIESWRTTYAGIISDQVLASRSLDARAAFWANLLSDPDRATVEYVAEDATDGVVGFASAGPERDGIPSFSSELYAIYFLEAFQRRGLGRSLVFEIARDLLLQDHQSMLVWVLADNPSRHFYTALGGRQVAAKTVTMGYDVLDEIAYGWDDLPDLADRLASGP